MNKPTIRAVFWDFGGVILSSPFDAFHAYERDHGLPAGFIGQVNSQHPDTNAWAQLERREITTAEFDARFADESAELGHRVSGADILALLRGSVRPEMVAALDAVNQAGYITACLTNNMAPARHADPELAAIMARFDHLIESSVVGCRKPDPAFYALACDTAGVEPSECVFLDDLGINLKPARAMGMTTIKVITPRQALIELGDQLNLTLID
ncbi:MAG: HAD family hydrolase [Ilumatobacter coccineus]|uniref:HAD family hydrolase n=1 Tax=Ilumatobacter coccineus TaxID=467094 RepID=A0A2G6KAA2_9ACTN|nr:MAG: HAD family hydrolase [Ilumatobacter coccineus]